jgi:heme exporter protein D
MSGDYLTALWVVSGLVFFVILYLIIDWIRGRRLQQNLERRKREARERWQEEQSQNRADSEGAQ